MAQQRVVHAQGGRAMPFGYAHLALRIKDGARHALAGARHDTQHRVRDIHSIPLDVIIMIAVYIALLRRAATKLRQPRQAPAAATP